MAGRPWAEEEERAIQQILESDLEWESRQSCGRELARVLPDRTTDAIIALIARKKWKIKLRGPRIDQELLRQMTTLQEAV